MPRAKYQTIYRDLKERIETGIYEFGELLPSENKLVGVYDCSRNTVRRALSALSEDGYVQPLHGVGVRVIYQPVRQTAFSLGGIESFRESALRNRKVPGTKVLDISTITVDERLSARTGFAVGEEVCL
ncbi:MAG: GntR family transcriptional regulator, partial [Lachnospiraceae bacterium]|nr:GntR family transcriptional regulator [Lachnospiraceae bacterium]